MTLEPGGVFLLAPNDLPTVKALPGVTGQLITKSKQSGGWLIACTFPGEIGPVVMASVVAKTWFDLGRWNITHFDPIPNLPRPLAVVMRSPTREDFLVDFDGNTIRVAEAGEARLLGSPRTCSPVRLLKACHAYAGTMENTPDLEDMTVDAHLARAALMAEKGIDTGWKEDGEDIQDAQDTQGTLGFE